MSTSKLGPFRWPVFDFLVKVRWNNCKDSEKCFVKAEERHFYCDGMQCHCACPQGQTPLCREFCGLDTVGLCCVRGGSV